MLEIRSFWGLVGSYQRFIQGFSFTMVPLTCEHSFPELKTKLTTAPVLTIPSEKEDFVVYSDASHRGLGCALMQQG